MGQADEIELWTFNEYDVYARLEALIDNYRKKAAKGIYDPELAVKGIMSIVIPDAIKKIRQADPSFQKVSKAEKKKAGKAIEKQVREDYL